MDEDYKQINEFRKTKEVKDLAKKLEDRMQLFNEPPHELINKYHAVLLEVGSYKEAPSDVVRSLANGMVLGVLMQGEEVN